MAPAINVWPALGTTVTLASGYVITAAGATSAWPNDEISRLLDSSKLLTFDPTGLNPNPSPIPNPGGGSGSGLVTDSMALLALISVVAGTYCQVLGFYTPNDGGGGTFYADAGSSTAVVPGMCVAASGGRWKRLHDPMRLESKWFGAKGDSTTDDTVALQTAINNMRDYGTLLLTGGNQPGAPSDGAYKITDGLRIGVGSGQNTVNSIHIIGEMRGDYPNDGGPYIKWDGPSTTTPAIWASGNDHTFEHFRIFVQNGRHLYSGIEIGWFDAGTPVFTSHCGFIGLQIGYDGVPARELEFCVTIGTKVFAGGNLESMYWTGCYFRGPITACVYVGSGQPYNMSFLRCEFRGGGGAPSGIGLQVVRPSSNYTLTDCDYQNLETIIRMYQPCTVTISGGEAESCKKMLFSYFPGGNVTAPFTVRDCRMSNAAIQTTGAGPNFWPNTDHAYLYMNGGGSINISGCYMIDSFVGDFAIGAENPVISTGNAWPNENMWQVRGFNSTGAANAGGVWSIGDSVVDSAVLGGNARVMPSMQGCYNFPGTATISGAATTVAVALPKSEWDTNYKIRLSVESITAGGVVGTLWASAKTAAGFTINVNTAPTVGKDLVVRWELYR